jgi:LacI family transcriptional regulator
VNVCKCVNPHAFNIQLAQNILAKTIYDIAKAAGVSIATVSRVFNSNNSVKKSTREKVLRIADEMGYHPQAYAQGLASKKKNRIMMLVPVISNYLFSEILKGIQNRLADLNFELNIVNINQDRGVFKQVEQVIKKQWADGYLFVSLHLSEKNLKKLKRYKVPISLVDDHSEHFDSVSFNNDEGGFVATSYLLKKGYSRIAFLSANPKAIPVKDRLTGYKKALSTYNIPFKPVLVVTGESMERDGFTEKNGYKAMKKILAINPRPDACFCTSDIKAVGALKAFKETGEIIPMISYDNLSITEYIGLSTVEQPMYHMGCDAISNLIERIDKNDSKDIKHNVYSPELIIRDSSETDIPASSHLS